MRLMRDHEVLCCAATHLSRQQVGVVLPCIVHGLADENEVVRDAAMQAGRIMVDAYAGSSMALLLPAIEDGIAESNWRIRSSAVELLGNLMFKIAGTSGNIRLDGGSDDEGASTEAQGRAIVEKLGMARRNEVRARGSSAAAFLTVVAFRSCISYYLHRGRNMPRRNTAPSSPKTTISYGAIVEMYTTGSAYSRRCELRLTPPDS